MMEPAQEQQRFAAEGEQQHPLDAHRAAGLWLAESFACEAASDEEEPEWLDLRPEGEQEIADDQLGFSSAIVPPQAVGRQEPKQQ